MITKRLLHPSYINRKLWSCDLGCFMNKYTIYKSKEGKRIISRHYESYLQSLPFEVERSYVPTSFGKTHVLVAGPIEGRPLFIFQGGNCINPMTLSWFFPLIATCCFYAAKDWLFRSCFTSRNKVRFETTYDREDLASIILVPLYFIWNPACENCQRDVFQYNERSW